MQNTFDLYTADSRNLSNFNSWFIKIEHFLRPSFWVVVIEGYRQDPHQRVLNLLPNAYLEYNSTISISFTGTSIASLAGSSFTVPFKFS